MEPSSSHELRDGDRGPEMSKAAKVNKAKYQTEKSCTERTLQRYAEHLLMSSGQYICVRKLPKAREIISINQN